MKMKWLDKIKTPVRKAWTKFSVKIGLRRSSGHVKLQNDVISCEYEDVHVLWELLKKNESNLTRSRKNSFWDFVGRGRSR